VGAVVFLCMKKYELIDHTADIGLRIFGGSLEELFQNAGFALFDVLTGSEKVMPREKRTFELERENLEELLVEWLGTLLYVFDTEQFLCSSFKVIRLDNNRLHAEAAGEYYQDGVHSIATAVKAITYHQLTLSEKNGLWEATVIVDV